MALVNDNLWPTCLISVHKLEHLHSEDTPHPHPRRPVITHTIGSYWILSQNKTKSNLKNLPKFILFKILTKNLTCDTPSEIAW